ncbi:hypothetical protein OS493_022014 [Desmophyllum pertusum]|uniref:Uncharacterized protein n=1 Tax=Desmophyllum pertusum TaxID=174260 RepID=A0A9W9YYT4_9CNID|nr:hypothetical protein OS493_022014 [Desmophyllum pertusum]
MIPTSPLQQVYPQRLEPSSSQETSLNIEQLDEAEEEGEEGHGLQQESNDELREKSSSQILRIHEGRMYEKN